MSSGKIGERTPAICINFCKPMREVRAISIAPRCTRTRFSPRSGTMSATVPSATINGDEQLWLMLFETALDTFATQAVAFLDAQRQKQFSRSRGTISAQHFIEQRQ